MKAIDKDGLSSDTVSRSVFVRTARPKMVSVRPDSSVFILDTRHYAISAIDSTNGRAAINSFYVSFNNTAFKTLTSATFDTMFTKQGKQYVHAYVKDSRGAVSDTLNDSITVNVGTPKVLAVLMDVAPEALFVLDNRTFTITGQDSHAIIDSIKIAWNGNTQFDAALKANANVAQFAKTFAIADT